MSNEELFSLLILKSVFFCFSVYYFNHLPNWSHLYTDLVTICMMHGIADFKASPNMSCFASEQFSMVFL